MEQETFITYITRPDGEIAKVEIPLIEEDDIWFNIWKAYPQAFDLMDDNAVLPDDGTEYRWDERFGPEQDDDGALALWYAEGIQVFGTTLADDNDCIVTVLARRREGTADVRWRAKDGTRYHQTIVLNDGDFEAIALGSDPVADKWEDGNGNLVCYDNAEEFRWEPSQETSGMTFSARPSSASGTRPRSREG